MDKICKDCRIILTNENWNNSFKKRSQYVCKACNYKRTLKWRNIPENKEKLALNRKNKKDKNIIEIRRKAKEWADKNKDKIKMYHIKHKDKQKNWSLLKNYNITLEDYNKILLKQNGKCAICGDGDTNKNMAVDHNHKTGIVRGILCIRCNTWLGKYENKEYLKSVDYYLNAKE